MSLVKPVEDPGAGSGRRPLRGEGVTRPGLTSTGCTVVPSSHPEAALEEDTRQEFQVDLRPRLPESHWLRS